MHKLLTLLSLLALPFAAQADRLMNETFAYDAGDLYGQGAWLQYAGQTDAPIQVGGTALTYEGYQSAPAGYSAQISNTANGQDLHYMFREVGNAVSSGSLYASALINVSSADGEVYFLALVSDSKAGLADKKSTTEYHRLFAKASDNEGKFLLGCSKNGASVQGETVELNLGETYLVVMKWEFVEGTMNDIPTVYVNPTRTEPATPTLAADVNKADPSTANGLIAVELRQGSTLSKTGPEVSVDAIRVATTWDELFEQADAPDVMTVAAEKLYAQEYAEVGQTVPYATYTVSTNNLQAPGSIYLTGSGSEQYTVEPTVIPAGTGTTQVTVNYVPTVAGKHEARVNFEVSPAEWNQGATLFAMAIDPAAPPTVTYDATALTPFSSKVEETQAQTLTLTSAHLIDYGTIRLVNPTGQFQLSSSSLMKDGETAITITFAPFKSGTFTDTIEVAAIGVPPTRFTVTGTTTSSLPPEETQGDAYELTTADPLSLLVEHFDGAVKNQPLAIDRWTNAALTGTRAWWGYTEEENGMAKVTPYDMKGTTEGEPCQMMLVTPPLAYAAAAEKLLTFRIKGQYLSDGQSDLLEVCYIDATGNEIYVEPIGGLDIPATADFNDQWRDYVLDLTGLDLADPFHIGFRFTSLRGKGNSATYYVDDVTWGRTDVAFIRPAQTTCELTAAPAATATATLHVTGLNLTSDITLKVTGANASRFTLSTSTLPAEGGDVVVTFAPEEEGLHSAYIEMTSDGAPASQIILTGHGATATGIQNAECKIKNSVVYDLAGRRISKPRHGVYVVGGRKVVR